MSGKNLPFPAFPLSKHLLWMRPIGFKNAKSTRGDSRQVGNTAELDASWEAADKLVHPGEPASFECTNRNPTRKLGT